MFQLDPKPTFDTTVEIPVPGARPRRIRVSFNHLTREPYVAALDAAKGKPAHHFVGCLVAGWATEDGAAQDDPADTWEGVAVPYSIEALERLFSAYPRASQAFVGAFNREMLGIPEKNS